jgi:hypothetical protein
MLGETHIRITKRIAEELKLGKREAGLLEAGSVNPDIWENFPHHEKRGLDIIENLIRARILFLRNDDECYHLLGVALHYIQDRWTLRPRLKDKHTLWEMSIHLADILDDSKFEGEMKSIILPIKAVEAYLTFLQKLRGGFEEIEEREVEGITFHWTSGNVVFLALLNRPTTWSNPIIDLNFAYRISREVACLVLEIPTERSMLDKLRELNVIKSRVSGFPKTYFEEKLDLLKIRDYIGDKRVKELINKLQTSISSCVGDRKYNIIQ